MSYADARLAHENAEIAERKAIGERRDFSIRLLKRAVEFLDGAPLGPLERSVKKDDNETVTFAIQKTANNQLRIESSNDGSITITRIDENGERSQRFLIEEDVLRALFGLVENANPKRGRN